MLDCAWLQCNWLRLRGILSAALRVVALRLRLVRIVSAPNTPPKRRPRQRLGEETEPRAVGFEFSEVYEVASKTDIPIHDDNRSLTKLVVRRTCRIPAKIAGNSIMLP